MAEPTTFADLWEQFNDEWDKFNEEYANAWDKCVDIINDSLRSIGQIIDDILPGENAAEKAAEKWDEEIAPALNEKYTEIVGVVSELVSDLRGDPMALQAYAEDFATAKRDLFKQRGFDEAQAAVAGTWAGAAYDAYVPVATKQNAALEMLANALDEGGMLTSEAAQKILQVWADLIYEFATFYADIISVLSGATSVENIISFEVPALLDALAKIVAKVAAVVKVLADFMVAQATTDTLKWVSLAGESGGLAGNQWPPIPGASSDGINDRQGWPAN